MISRIFSVAPMMGCTDRHFRYLLRLISQHALLYTEMITTGALLYGNYAKFLQYDPIEHPIALQVGGSDPAALGRCAKLAEDFGYDEINLNVGCPSSRVQAGGIGACLMLEPDLVANCVANMRANTKIPVTVKTRIGVDHNESYDFLTNFIEKVAKAGCQDFIIHARKAWLKGLSPKENREIPPLHYATVYQIKRDFPQLNIVINGGFNTLEAAIEQLTKVDGVMLGHAVYDNPYLMGEVDKLIFEQPAPYRSIHQIIEDYLPYVEMQLTNGIALSQITKHLLGLFTGQPGARAWRRYLSQHANQAGAGIEVIQGALSNIQIA